MLEIKKLQKAFGRHLVFNYFNFSFPDHGLFFLVGENGCGKSTLIYIISGLDEDYKGDVVFNNRNLRTLSKKEKNSLRRKDIGLLFSRGNLLSFLNADENRLFDLHSDSLNFIDLPPKSSTFGLSGGEELLLALSNELAKNKKIYLLDEVTSNLDSTHLKKIMSILNRQSDRSLIIMATHDNRIINCSQATIVQIKKI